MCKNLTVYPTISTKFDSFENAPNERAKFDRKMLSPMSQPCDLIKETSLVGSQQQQLPPSNCSNNSIATSSIDGSAQGYLAPEKPLARFQHNQSVSGTISQPVTPQFNLRANLRLDSEATNSPISFKTDTDILNQFSADDLIYRIKSLETKNRKLLFENGCLVRDLNSNLANVQFCKQEISQLRDLCVYLDDERTKARLTATEWAIKLKKEINSYSRKLSELESKQFELVRENYELKQLCLLLDKAMANKVDEEVNEKEEEKLKEKGTNDSLKDCKQSTGKHKDRKGEHKEKLEDATSEPVKQRSLLNSKVIKYIRQLEIKLEQCEMHRQSTLSLLNDRNVPLEEPIRELEKFKLNLDELKSCRPEEIAKGIEVFLVQQSLEPNLSESAVHSASQLDGGQPNRYLQEDAKHLDESCSDLNESPDDQINEEQRSIIKQLCSAAYKKIESE